MFIPFPNTTLALLVLAVGILLLIIKRNRFFSLHTLIVLAFFFYLFKVVQVTLFPIRTTLATDLAIQNGHYYFNTHLFYSVYAAIRDQNYIQVIGNVLLLFPLGFFIPLLSRTRPNLVSIVLWGFGGSLAIESTQLLFNMLLGSGRLFDLDDLLLNTAGALIGYAVFLILKRFFRRNPFVNTYFAEQYSTDRLPRQGNNSSA